jgi:serine-type D-Ala-D-Ala carboxypeptidase/endopeptidase
VKRSQELLLDEAGSKDAYGWSLDGKGRYWHNGGTGGYHSFAGFDPQNGTAVVVLAATASSLVDRLASSMFDVAAGSPTQPVRFPDASAMAPLVGRYLIPELGEQGDVRISLRNGRLYAGSPNETPSRLIPLTGREYLIESLQTVVVFEEDAGKITRMVFAIGQQRFVAGRVAQ